MAKKIQYRSTSIEHMKPETLANALNGARKLVVAIDVAKTKMVAGFGSETGAVARLVKWTSPSENRAFVELIQQAARLLEVPVEAIMEPTGTYGEPLRALLLAGGVGVYVVSPKRVHDAAEVFDGVPSMHDAKACVVIARLHQQAISTPYVPPDSTQVRLRALVDQRELYAKPLQFYLGRLESLLARHWPEALQELDVWHNKTPLALLSLYPGPTLLLEHKSEVLSHLHQLGHKHLMAAQAQRMLECAQRSTGIEQQVETEQLVRVAAAEALRMRNALDQLDAKIEAVAQETETTRDIARVVGKVTAVVLIAHLGAFTRYSSAAALEKACGLNLKIRSSGNHVGRPSLTKRGSSTARRYLYLAALRLVQDDDRVAQWYRLRGGYRSGHKLCAAVAVMRKLVRALWHVARGHDFDSSKLIDERALPPTVAQSTALATQTLHDAQLCSG